MRPQNLEREIQSLCVVCGITDCAPTRATACGSRVAQMWNLWGPPNLEREIQSVCDVCGITDVSTTRHNLTATCSDIHTRVCAHARNCLWQQRGTYVEPLGVTKSGT